MALTPSRLLELIAALCFLVAAAGISHVGAIALEAAGLFFLALGLAF